METAVVKRKPRLRAGASDAPDKLNRFLLVDAMRADKTKGAAQLVRLASISRAQLASVRRLAAGIKFELDGEKWRLKLEQGFGTPPILFVLSQKEMCGVAELLAVSLSLALDPAFLKSVDWEELKRTENFVNGVVLYDTPKSPDLLEFIGRVAVQLKELECDASYLKRSPPFDLDKLVLHGPRVDYKALGRHKIRRLDVPMWELGRNHSADLVLPASITSLGLVEHLSLFNASPDAVNEFCRRFPALEDLHLIGSFRITAQDLVTHFKDVWAKCLELRDRLVFPGLRRIFFSTGYPKRYSISKPKPGWMEQLKQVEPFDKATVQFNPSTNSVRVLLKHNEPRGPKPCFFEIENNFYWPEVEETSEDSVDLLESSDGWDSSDAILTDAISINSSDDAVDDAGF
ncbi:hypothetical protein M3Y99_00528000 [Aphelenchoides fujianensis]|nr:hypothetical protein M3Y99_00528000 [Aphelenchoides fujianensis]